MKRFLLVLFISSGLFASAQISKPIPGGLETKVKVLKFYPNPAVSSINFDFQKTLEKGFTLQIYNFVGKKVAETSALSAKTSISLNEFYRGVYIFQLRDRSGRIVDSGKFQVVK